MKYKLGGSFNLKYPFFHSVNFIALSTDLQYTYYEYCIYIQFIDLFKSLSDHFRRQKIIKFSNNLYISMKNKNLPHIRCRLKSLLLEVSGENEFSKWKEGLKLPT